LTKKRLQTAQPISQEGVCIESLSMSSHTHHAYLAALVDLLKSNEPLAGYYHAVDPLGTNTESMTMSFLSRFLTFFSSDSKRIVAAFLPIS
jgi:hypothetical protein